MATRQPVSKSGKRGTPSGANSLAKNRTSAPAGKQHAKSATRGQGGAQAKAAAAAPTAPSVRSGIGGAWQAILDWAGGGFALSTLIVSLLGVADASYLTYQHFSAATTFVGCSDKGTVNCEAVTTSAWSHFLGMPVSVLGLAFFVFMVVVNSPWGWRSPIAAVHWARLVSVIVGMVFVLYLIWAELFRINAICLYCTGVHILTFLLFALVVGKVTFSGVRPMADKR